MTRVTARFGLVGEGGSGASEGQCARNCAGSSRPTSSTALLACSSCHHSGMRPLGRRCCGSSRGNSSEGSSDRGGRWFFMNLALLASRWGSRELMIVSA